MTSITNFFNKLTAHPDPQPPVQQASRLDALLSRIQSSPTSAQAHCQLADYYLQAGSKIAAIAEYRTALAFEQSDAILTSLAGAYRAAGFMSLAEKAEKRVSAGTKAPEPASRRDILSSDAKPLLELDPTRFQRLQALADRVNRLFPDKPPRILDLGGGDGLLCLFLPDVEYVLAEPSTNGLGSTSLIGKDHSFDIVVACHVFEHIPPESRDSFLSWICRKSRAYVVVLGPFATHPAAGLADRLFYEITRFPWAQEHVDCGLPELESVQQFAAQHDFPIEITPNGAAAAVYWMVFALHFSDLAGKQEEFKRVTEFFNTHYSGGMSNPHQPNDYLVQYDLRNHVGFRISDP